MSDTPPKSWEPDPRRAGNWRDMFEPKGGSGQPQTSAAPAPPPISKFDDTDLDVSVYRPWTLQRGGRPPIMLELRRYEPRSGLWCGWQLSYPSLLVVEFTGDRLLTLDFGTRYFAITGTGLDELSRHLRQGSVVEVQEFAAVLWPAYSMGSMVKAIQEVETTR